MKVAAQPLYAATAAAWRAWLKANHAVAKEVWLVLHKKHVTKPCVSLEEATQEAMCFGWVDSLQRRIDDEKHALRFTPRSKRSVWSESNKQRVAALIAQGRMTPAGLAAVEEAKRNGEWDKQPSGSRTESASRGAEAQATGGAGEPPSHPLTYHINSTAHTSTPGVPLG
jgi:uncharacterized protein YdeI (YjbR/CyaY-like superfamily)